MTYTRESAQELATSALLYLAGRPDLVEEFLLASQRVRPSRLLDDGFRFGHEQLARALAGEIER